MDDLHPIDDHSHKFFVWPEWIAANGPLTAESAFEYFTTSMFYDKQSNNQVLRMQTMHTGLPLENEAEELRRFTGIEFALVHAEPPLFIIHKRERFSKDEVRPLAAYFIVHNRIYQSPDLHSILSNRLLTTVHSLQSALDSLRNYRPEFAPRTGFVWPVIDDQAAPDGKADTRAQSAAAAEIAGGEPEGESGQKAKKQEKKQENLALMYNAMRTTAAHMQTSSTTKLSENLMGLGDTPFDTTVSPSSGLVDSGMPVETPGTIASSQPSADAQVKESAPVVKKKKKKGTLPQTPAPQTPS